MTHNTPKKIHIFDTTLRDGQQSPGAAMSLEDNVKYAQIATKLNIDVLEAWFPSASAYEFDRVQKIIEVVGKDWPMIVWLTQVREHLVDTTIECLLPASAYGKWRMHIYFPVDPWLIKAWLGDKDLSQFPALVHQYCARARDAWLSVEFSPEGYSRMGDNFWFCTDIICAAIEWWATIINCPDSVWASHPRQGADYYVNHMVTHASLIKEKYPEKEIIRSVHNHNDMWCAVENSILGIRDGPATQIECTMNGVGERAWNCSLEQVVMIINQYGELLWITTDINLEHLQEASDFIGERMLPRQPHRPITWDNAAKHTAWSHINAILKHPTIYQPFDPKIVWKEWISMVFWPSSWWNHAMKIVTDAGYEFPKEQRAEFAQYVKDTNKERYKWVTDEELVAAFLKFVSPIKITEFNYAKQHDHASLFLHGTFFDEVDVQQEADSKDSALAILQKLCAKKIPWRSVDHYSSQAETASVSATSVAHIRIKHEWGDISEWVGIDNDIEISALKALIDAYNTLYVESEYRK